MQPFKYLSELRLDRNKLTTLNPNIFNYSTCLEILDLSYNPIVNIDQQTAAAIKELKKLKVCVFNISL